VVEVKTELSSTGLKQACKKLADSVERIRIESKNPNCWAGLFVYDAGRLSHQTVLKTLAWAANGDRARVVNSVSLGTRNFTLFWDNVEPYLINEETKDPVWHSYDLLRLAPAYFVSNLVVEVSPEVPAEMYDAWFPIEGTKETKRSGYCSLITREFKKFPTPP
jgi:hypothetical protein